MAHPRSSLRLPLPFAIAGIVALASACGDNGTGPGPMKPADPLATAANIEALNTSFSSQAFEAFALASFYSPAATSSFGVLRTLLPTAGPALAGRPPSLTESRLAAAALRAALVPSSGAIPASVLPPEVLGKTFEWDTVGSSGYIATDRTGADSKGVRFILYALDPVYPILPLQEIGYADLIDESTNSVQTLHILVVGNIGPTTYMDYRVSATTTKVTVVGFITDGVHRLDFNCTLSGNVLDIRFDMNADDAHVRLAITASVPDANTTILAIDFRLQFGTEVVTVKGTLTETTTTSGNLTVRVNGGVYPTVTITDDVASFAPGAGLELTADDFTALNAIYDAVFGVLFRFFDLLAPALGLLG